MLKIVKHVARPPKKGMKLQERSSCESDVVRVALLGRIEPSPLAVSYASVRAALHQGAALGPLRRVRGVPTGSNAAVFEVAKSVLAETVFGLNTVFLSKCLDDCSSAAGSRKIALS